MTDIERIGLRQHYKGSFRLAKCDDLLGRYFFPAVMAGKAGSIKDFKPIVDLDTVGIFVGSGMFVPINSSDLFYETEPVQNSPQPKE